jgi:hypothetical protein
VTGLGTDRSLSQNTMSRDTVRDTTNRESLGFLAAETGGRLFKDANDLKPALAEMLEMTSRYYVLGFQPETEKGPGAFHKIRVKVNRKGVKLSHRPGYFERAPVDGQTTLQRQFDLAELVVRGGDRDEIPFTSLFLPFPAPGERQTLGLVMQVPASLRWTKERPVSIEVYGYVVAETERCGTTSRNPCSSNRERQTLTIRLGVSSSARSACPGRHRPVDGAGGSTGPAPRREIAALRRQHRRPAAPSRTTPTGGFEPRWGPTGRRNRRAAVPPPAGLFVPRASFGCSGH